MKQTINFYDFERAFLSGSYKDNFTYYGLKALWDYLEDYEDSCDTEIEFDVVSIACEFNEYVNIKEYVDYYRPDISNLDYDDINDYYKAVEKHIEYNTTLIKLSEDINEGFIIQCY